MNDNNSSNYNFTNEDYNKEGIIKNRPYLKSSTDDLSKLFDQVPNNYLELKILEFELIHRKSNTARDLADKINNKLRQIEMKQIDEVNMIGRVPTFGRLYYLSGELMYQGFIIDGKPFGCGISYKENGEIIFEGSFTDNYINKPRTVFDKERIQQMIINYDYVISEYPLTKNEVNAYTVFFSKVFGNTVPLVDPTIRSTVFRVIEENLFENEKQVIIYRFGLRDGVQRTYDYIGWKMDITNSWVRQLEKRALLKLKHLFEVLLNNYISRDNTL